MSGVRAQVKGVSTTVDLLAGMGLKYVHATNKGRKGQMGDLEKSREQVRYWRDFAGARAFCVEIFLLHSDRNITKRNRVDLSDRLL
jgi:hypothetical protein